MDLLNLEERLLLAKVEEFEVFFGNLFFVFEVLEIGDEAEFVEEFDAVGEGD